MQINNVKNIPVLVYTTAIDAPVVLNQSAGFPDTTLVCTMCGGKVSGTGGLSGEQQLEGCSACHWLSQDLTVLCE